MASRSARRQAYLDLRCESNVIYQCQDRTVWKISNDLILKQRSTSGANHEVTNIRFLESKTTIRVPHVVDHWAEDSLYFEAVRYISGQTLEEAWPKLSSDSRHRIARQVAGHLEELRALQSPRMESVDHKPLYSCFLFGGDYIAPHGPFDTDEAFWADLKRQFTDKDLPRANLSLPRGILEVLRKRMPPCAPYTFSHSDLAMVNIMIKDGNLAAIIDWESSGYFPVWWEYAFARIGLGSADKEWKNLLRKYMTPFEHGHNFYGDLFLLRTRERDPVEYDKLVAELVAEAAKEGKDGDRTIE